MSVSYIDNRGTSSDYSRTTTSNDSASSDSLNSTITRSTSTPIPANIDKSKIEYVIGIDLGHGETSAAICPTQWDKLDDQLDPAKDLTLEGNNKVLPSSIAILNNGDAVIGSSAFNPEILKQAKVHVCFKQKPTNINGDAEQLMIKFMREVYRKIRANNLGMLTNTNHVVYIATPSGWDNDAQELYLKMAQKAGIPMGGVTKESRAAFVRAQHDPTANLGRNIEKGAIVFDMGSSTLDFTYHNASLSKMIDNGYNCGASFVEKAMLEDLERNNDAIGKFRSKYPDLIDYILFEVRRAKEDIYFDTARKYKKTLNFEDFIDDEDLEDERMRLKYEPGELNAFLESIGYIQKIREAMRDFICNHISGMNIYGVFLTGGASRMDFIKSLVTQCWNVPEAKIFRDQDPSLTISQGVAELARMDLRTSNLSSELEPLFRKVKGSKVYDAFVESFGQDLYETLSGGVANEIVKWAEDAQNRSLNRLNSFIKVSVKETVDLGAKKVGEYVHAVIDQETSDLRAKVDAIVKAYTAQGATIKIPSFTNIETIGASALDMDGVMRELSDVIETESDNWAGAIGGAALGAAAALIFGGPLAWIIGGGALLGKWLFGENETEEQKRQKAMQKKLTADQRHEVYNALNERWSVIDENIKDAVFSSLAKNKKAKQQVSEAVDKLMLAYRNALKNARIMVD
jgi:molecular chaperone DnaK (HSP70)